MSMRRSVKAITYIVQLLLTTVASKSRDYKEKQVDRKKRKAICP